MNKILKIRNYPDIKDTLYLEAFKLIDNPNEGFCEVTITSDNSDYDKLMCNHLAEEYNLDVDLCDKGILINTSRSSASISDIDNKYCQINIYGYTPRILTTDIPEDISFNEFIKNHRRCNRKRDNSSTGGDNNNNSVTDNE